MDDSQYLYNYIDDLYKIKKLWCSVLDRAILDVFFSLTALGGKPIDNARYKKMIKNDSFHFLFYDKQNFPTVCDLAGINPSYLRRKLASRFSSKIFNLLIGL